MLFEIFFLSSLNSFDEFMCTTIDAIGEKIVPRDEHVVRPYGTWSFLPIRRIEARLLKQVD
jgi:hypothetical protein